MSEAAIHLAQRQGARALRPRRRAPAARRLRSDLDVRRDPPDPSPRQGTRAHRPVGVLVRADAASIVPNHLLALRDDGRSLECRRLEMLPVEIVVRGYLSGSGLEGLRGTGLGVRPSAAARSARIRPPARADRHAGDEGAVRPRREHRRARCGRPGRRRALGRGRNRSRSRSTASRPHTPRRAESSSPTRSSSSGSTTTARSCSETRH